MDSHVHGEITLGARPDPAHPMRPECSGRAVAAIRAPGNALDHEITRGHAGALGRDGPTRSCASASPSTGAPLLPASNHAASARSPTHPLSVPLPPAWAKSLNSQRGQGAAHPLDLRCRLAGRPGRREGPGNARSGTGKNTVPPTSWVASVAGLLGGPIPPRRTKCTRSGGGFGAKVALARAGPSPGPIAPRGGDRR